ncbi:hypothetical protein FB451DRAFT_1478937 [Mycena latifolia]|nr:hypothetical protein FB451DRAFT_1478937 [Mycena latifolia]
MIVQSTIVTHADLRLSALAILLTIIVRIMKLVRIITAYKFFPDLVMHYLHISACKSSRALSRAPSFESSPAHGPPHHPYVQRSSSDALSTIYDLPDPAMLNQYADRGLQDFQHPPAHHAPESGPDVATLFSGVDLRQNHLDDQNRMLLEVNAKLQSLIDSLESTQSSTQPALSIPTRGIRVGIRGRPKRVTSVSTGTDASPHESSTELGSPTPPSNAAPKHSPSLGVPAALSPAQRKMRLDLKRINEVTGEAYLTPNFAGGVTDVPVVNIRIFAAVAIQIVNEFKDAACQPDGLADCGATWDVGDIHFRPFEVHHPPWLLLSCAPKDFKGLKDRRNDPFWSSAGNTADACPLYSTMRSGSDQGTHLTSYLPVSTSPRAMALKSNPITTSSSASERARRAASRSGSVTAADTARAPAQNALAPVVEDTPTTAGSGGATPADDGNTDPSPTSVVPATTAAVGAPNETTPDDATPTAAVPALENNTTIVTEAPPIVVATAPVTEAPAAAVAAPTPATATNVGTVPATTATANTAPIVIDVDALSPAPAQPTAIEVDTPVLPPARPDSPAPRDEEYPRLPAPGAEIMSHAARRKEKGKSKAKTTALPPPPPESTTDTLDDIDLGSFDQPNPPAPSRQRYDADEENIRRGIAASLGLPVDTDNRASSSRQTATIAETILAHVPPSPPRCPATNAPDAEPEARRRRADTEGHAFPVNEVRHHYGTVNGLPPRGSYMPTPADGHRTIMGMSRPVIFRNHPPQQQHQWDGAPAPKLLCWISGGNNDRLQMAPRLQAHIANRLNMNPSDVRVGAPGLGEGPGPDPIVWLISVPEEQAEVLLDIGALNADDGLLTFFIPYDPPLTPFLCTFTGFTIPEADAALALAIIGGAIADDPTIARFVKGHRDAFPAHVTADEAHARFTESVYVIPLPLRSPRGNFIAWNAYAHPPTHNEGAWASLQELVGKLIIDTVYNGEGRLYRSLYCHICRSVDHPTNICPITSLPGYMGPTAETIGALEDASREALLGGRNNKFQRNASGSNAKGSGKGKGKGKDRDDRKGGDNRRK